MKKLYTLITLCAFSVFGFSQVEIRVFEGGAAVGPDLAGTTHEVVVTSADLHQVVFQVKNTTGSPQEWRLMRYRVAAPPAGWTDGLCWGPYPDTDAEGQCYAPSNMPTNPWLSPTDMTIVENGNIIADIHTGDQGCGVYRYYVMEGASRIDSVDVEVCFALSVDEQEELAGMTAYPNPANGQLTVATTGMDGNYEIRVTDVLGKVVHNETVSGAKKSIDVSGFRNGVYLVTVLDKGTVVQTRRVVVKH